MTRRATLATLLLALGLAAGCGGTLQEQQRGNADYEAGKAAFDRSDWYDAINDLKAYVEQFPGTEKTDDALYYLGRSYFGQKDYALASSQFDRLIRDFPQSPYQAPALYYLARCDDLDSRQALLDQTETRRALDRYKQFLDVYPNDEHAAEAHDRVRELRDRLAEKRYRNGRLYVKLHQPRAAKIYLQGVLTEYPESKWAGDAALLLADVLLKEGKKDEAIAALKKIPDDVASADVKRRAEERLRSLTGPGEPR
ncbi:MAG: outer membrane protein assembly factor BamD [Hyphomicrobiales bacterium]